MPLNWQAYIIMAVKVTARDQERNCAPGVPHTDTFDLLKNGVIFQADFCVFCLIRMHSWCTNFRAKKARENLRREKGAKEIRKKKTKEYSAILFCPGEVQMCLIVILYIVIKCAA